MKQVIMAREIIERCQEWLIDPYTLEEQREIWRNEYGNTIWNEYYRVGVYDSDKYEDEFTALNEEGHDFDDRMEALAYYEQLKAQENL